MEEGEDGERAWWGAPAWPSWVFETGISSAPSPQAGAEAAVLVVMQMMVVP